MHTFVHTFTSLETCVHILHFYVPTVLLFFHVFHPAEVRKRKTEERRKAECTLLLKVASEPLDSFVNFSPINLKLVSRDCITRLVCLTSGHLRVCACMRVCVCVCVSVCVCVTDSQSKSRDDCARLVPCCHLEYACDTGACVRAFRRCLYVRQIWLCAVGQLHEVVLCQTPHGAVLQSNKTYVALWSLTLWQQLSSTVFFSFANTFFKYMHISGNDLTDYQKCQL